MAILNDHAFAIYGGKKEDATSDVIVIDFKSQTLEVIKGTASELRFECFNKVQQIDNENFVTLVTDKDE